MSAPQMLRILQNAAFAYRVIGARFALRYLCRASVSIVDARRARP
jgi:hypothetical protein